MARKPHRTSQAVVKERNEVLKAGLESLIHNKQTRETEPQKPKKTISAINPVHVKVTCGLYFFNNIWKFISFFWNYGK